MTHFIKWSIASLLIFFSHIVLADSEGPPYSYVATTLTGRYYFKMIPENGYDREKGKGICYEVKSDGTDKKIWKTKGWYSFKVYLSNDGKYLIRMGNWSRGQELSDKDLAVAFYKEGKLLKEYSTKDLVKDPSAIVRTVSHYAWKGDLPVFNPYKNIFQLTTIDNIKYIFNVLDGEIISQQKTE